MAAILLNWDHIHPSLHWGKPVIESALQVIGRAKYQLRIDSSEVHSSHKVHADERRGTHTLSASFDIYHDGEYLAKVHMSVRSISVSIEMNGMVSVDRDDKIKPFMSYREGRGRRSRKLKRYGHLKRPGVRKWAVCTIQSILHSKSKLVTEHVMET